MRCFDPIFRTRAGLVALALVGLGGLSACSSVSLLPVRPVPRPPPALTLPAEPPAPEPLQPAPEAPAINLPAPPAPLPPASAAMVESPGVAARFPDPALSYATPAFAPGHTDFTSNAELRNLLHGLLREGGPNGTTVRLQALGSSQRGEPLEALLFTRRPDAPSPGVPGRPTVLLIGQQHGDEPAGSEALLVVAQELAHGSLGSLLDRIDVVVLARANPDGAAARQRTTASGIDANRDHLLLRTPEAQAQARLLRDFAPVVVVDAHEYPVAGLFLAKFGALQRFDAQMQYATVANLPPFVTRAAEEWFRQPMLAALKREGLSAGWYYTISADVADKKVSMGGVRPDTGRNVSGLTNAVSILIETRGAGLGKTHLARRVLTQVTAIASVLGSAAGRADDLMKLRQFVDREVSAMACQGDAVIEAEATPSEYSLPMLDPQTGADKSVTVTWDSALELHPLKIRPRPCGYWLAADQSDAVLRLRGLGVQVQRLDEAGALRGEVYREVARREAAPPPDARGESLAFDDADGALRVKVETVAGVIDAGMGSYYVPLDQPWANLVLAALEPDTANSYVANRIVSGVAAQARVMLRPEVRMTPVP